MSELQTKGRITPAIDLWDMKALIYFATEAPVGAVVEHSEISGTKGKVFERVAQIDANLGRIETDQKN